MRLGNWWNSKHLISLPITSLVKSHSLFLTPKIFSTCMILSIFSFCLFYHIFYINYLWRDYFCVENCGAGGLIITAWQEQFLAHWQTWPNSLFCTFTFFYFFFKLYFTYINLCLYIFCKCFFRDLSYNNLSGPVPRSLAKTFK